MRKLSGKLVINEATFGPEIQLLLDGEETGTIFAIEAVADIKVLHGEEAEAAFIGAVIDNLGVTHNLTPEESAHYVENFKELITLDQV